MKIATWNVNSLKVRLPHVLDWLAANQPDAPVPAGAQESRTRPSPSPRSRPPATRRCSAGQKTYNGVAILSRSRWPTSAGRHPRLRRRQKRIIAGTLDGVRIVCGCFPNGQAVGLG